MTDLAFTSFGFKATNALTDRTMPDRLAEVKNVMDFGAYNDASHATETRIAIQAAVDWTAGANRGTILFPPGSYLVDAPITFDYDGDLSICFRGEVANTVHITGSVDGYIFDRSLATPNNTTGGRIFEKMKISNSFATGGCIRIGSSLGAVIRDCVFSAHTGITTEDAVGESSENVLIQTCQFGIGSGTVSGAHHIIIGGGGSIQNCAVQFADTGVLAYGSGLHASGNRMERNNTAWKLGVDSGGNQVGLSGFSLTASTYEGNRIAFDLAGPCDGFYIGSHNIQGHDSTNAGAVESLTQFTGSISGTTLTVLSAVSGFDVIQVGQIVGHLDGADAVTAGTAITAHLGGGGGSGSTWTVNHSQTVGSETLVTAAAGTDLSLVQSTQYSIRIGADCATNGVIESIGIGSWHDVACVDIADATSRTNLVIRNITATTSGGAGADYVLPTNAYTALIENCNTPVVWTYSQLPSGGNVLEGDEFDISNSNTATWGATAAGGGSSRVRVRYNGTNYTVVGK